MAIFFAMPGNEELAGHLADLTSGEVGKLEIRRFPDGETYVRILSEVSRKDAFIVCTLARADKQFIPLSFTAATILELGVERLQLIAPYLAYMRQDRVFHSGEGLTSRMFAELVQQHFHGLITVDPHLHRHGDLDEVYDIPSTVLHAGPLLAEWISTQVDRPFIIGPDEESAQWIQAIAQQAGVPWTVFRKRRLGDRKIEMQAPDLERYRGWSPVLIDDIVSSGTTLRRAMKILRQRKFGAPFCLAVHALCTRRTAQQIRDNSAAFATSNSVQNAAAVFDIAPLIAGALVDSAALRVA